MSEPGIDFEKLTPEQRLRLAVFLRSDVHTRWPFNRWGDHYLAVLAKRGF